MNQKKNSEEELRIGVFICDCGSNIAGHVDCKSVTEYASRLPGVVYAKENLYTCSESGIGEIKSAIREHNLNRVVVASCSPRTHQPLFQSSCASEGLNPYLFEMVNIRDQCSWVHMQDPEKATEKAKDLVRMGVAKARFLEPQQDIESDITRKVLVIGGGIAGISATEAISDIGLDVILIEKEPKLGGLVKDLHMIAPAFVNAREQISEMISGLESKSNVTIYTGATLESIDGFVGNYVAGIGLSDGKKLEEKVGCIVVATGAVPLQEEGLFGYNGKDIITQMELEDLLKKGEFKSRQVVMIQCAGARIPEREYCSRICCMTAIKNAMIIKRMNEDTRINILYRDIQMYGTEKEKMLWDARGMGIRFDIYTPDNPPMIQDKVVKYYQPLTGEEREIPYDIVVLSTPLIAPEGAQILSQLLRIPVDQYNFFLEAHAKLRPLDFATDGVFLCGSARFPSTVDEARSQGIGVASRIANILFKEKLVSSAIVAEINPDTCVGCKGCMDMCPYGAISYDSERNICQVNEILCKGCGCCASTCPSHSAVLKGFKPRQLLSQIRAIAGE